MNEILGYVIPAAALIVVQLIVSFKQDKVNSLRLDMTIQEIKGDIARLESKQDKHNQLIERMVAVEQSNAAQWKWIDQFKEVLKNRGSKEV